MFQLTQWTISITTEIFHLYLQLFYPIEQAAKLQTENIQLNQLIILFNYVNITCNLYITYITSCFTADPCSTGQNKTKDNTEKYLKLQQ